MKRVFSCFKWTVLVSELWNSVRNDVLLMEFGFTYINIQITFTKEVGFLVNEVAKKLVSSVFSSVSFNQSSIIIHLIPALQMVLALFYSVVI